MTEPKGAAVVSIGSALLKSKSFDVLFGEAMKLVEDTAAYLDGEGRKDSKQLSRDLALAYATESMRLTTRLMVVASWMLTFRAVREGEMTEPEFKKNKGRSSMHTLQKRGDAPAEGLPEKLRVLITRCDAMAQSVLRFDAMLEPGKASAEAPAEGTLKPLAIVRDD